MLLYMRTIWYRLSTGVFGIWKKRTRYSLHVCMHLCVCVYIISHLYTHTYILGTYLYIYVYTPVCLKPIRYTRMHPDTHTRIAVLPKSEVLKTIRKIYGWGMEVKSDFSNAPNFINITKHQRKVNPNAGIFCNTGSATVRWPSFAQLETFQQVPSRNF